MQVRLTDAIQDSPEGREAAAILGACVHCGFCNATCPTYTLLGSELDAPRGRIYLLKMLLEGHETSERTRRHLDRCLSCRACETTCPSGVAYGRLADIGRGFLEEKLERPRRDRLLRLVLRKLMTHAGRFGALLSVARLVRPLLPAKLKARVPVLRPAPAWPSARHDRRMLVLNGCVQPALAPSIDAAAAGVLDRLGISLDKAPGSGCCGGLSYHLGAHREGLDFMRRNIDAWWPHLEAGAEAIVVTASGCGAMVKEYGLSLRHDPAYAEKARQVSERARDIAEVVAAEDLSKIRPGAPGKIAFQSPCSLQHGQKLAGVVESLLKDLGFELTPVAEPHLCCGSAGTYSLLQQDLANQLRARKLAALEAGEPELIATANIGCLSHLEAAATRPVRHWIELVAPVSRDGVSAP